MTERRWLSLGVVAILALSAIAKSDAAILINEVFVNPPGTDDTQEFFELKSTTGGVESLAGLHLLILEGEGASTGTVDQAFNLDAFSTGTNGLFYWRANVAVGSFTPSPAAASTVNTADFVPDLENGTQTYVLVGGYNAGAAPVGTDLDADNNGVLDGPLPWSSVADSIGVRDTTLAGDFTYGASLGFADFPIAPAGFEAEVILRLSDTDAWVASDIAGTNPGGPYTFDATETIFTDGSVVPVAMLDYDDVSPGSVNPKIVPEPATWILSGIAALLATLMGRRRRCLA